MHQTTGKGTHRTLHHRAHLLRGERPQAEIGPGVRERGQPPQQGLEGGSLPRGDGPEEAEVGVGARHVVAAGQGEAAGVEEGGEGGEHLEGGAVGVFDEDPLAPVFFGWWGGG